jgi:hypothetical protein
MRAVLGVLAVAALLLAVPATAYPPHTCGQVTHSGTAYVVRTHGPSCGTALRGVRTFLAHHRSISGFRCRSYPGSIPAYCKNRKHKLRYFFASPA